MEVERLRPTIHKDWNVEHVNPDDKSSFPVALIREFEHPDFLFGARFTTRMAAVAQMNAHFPSFTLERRIVRKTWQVVTSIRCQTVVLGGLSTHDFHLAMVRFGKQLA